MVGLSQGAGILILVLGGIFVFVAGATFTFRSRSRREEAPDIPAAMKPGPSDAALETPLLHKLQGWGVLLVAFFVVWIPVYWLQEPSANLKQEEELKSSAIDRGSHAILLFSEENQLGVGCVRCHGPELRGGVIVNGTNADGSIKYAYPANLTTVCGGPSTGHPAIKSIEDIYTTIEQGRIDAGMPSWSIRYAGALDDQQINDIVNYLVWMSSKNVPESENVCTNPDAVKAATSPSASASASPSASESP
jgi:mono/diheme cytochrome c family protein